MRDNVIKQLIVTISTKCYPGFCNELVRDHEENPVNSNSYVKSATVADKMSSFVSMSKAYGQNDSSIF
ncbi:hypothetical protein NFHSH190041_30460 [Shewanella sp. NFH-SH190041]|nr:hypothetical protein NFHSH190041_30460 [Shewanella sp. NFH-SH190041]